MDAVTASLIVIEPARAADGPAVIELIGRVFAEYDFVWDPATEVPALPVDPARIADLAAIRTRLDRFKEQEQCELINWGYAVSDAALRSRAPAVVFRPQAPAWPYPRHALS